MAVLGGVIGYFYTVLLNHNSLPQVALGGTSQAVIDEDEEDF